MQLSQFLLSPEFGVLCPSQWRQVLMMSLTAAAETEPGTQVLAENKHPLSLPLNLK